MDIPIVKLVSHAKLPAYAHKNDAGMDLFAAQEVCLQPQERIVVSTGIAMQIPAGFVGLVWDKSGRALRDGLKTMAGVIDSSYRGEIQVVLLNISSRSITIMVHEKIAQLLIQPVVSATLKEVTKFDDSTARGANGFGSTGLN